MDRLCSFSFLLLLFSIFLIFPNCMCSSPLLHEACKSTGDYKFCIKTLDSDPRTATADLVGLCNISLDLTFHNASDTHEYISRLLENATDPNMKKSLENCFTIYGDALDVISQAYKWFVSKVYDNVNADAEGVSALALTCENSLGEEKKVESHKSPLSLRNDNLIRLGNIVRGISFLLDPDLLQ